MRELSLFSGIGGGLLGTLLLGWHPVGYVEWDDYCQRVLRQRIDDGIFPNAPIFGDIQSFNRDGYAAAYQGLVDVVTGGFPCQPFSAAGKRTGKDDARNMWPATIETIRLVRPRYALLENVPGLLSSGYFGTILGDLAESGYDARWRILSAAEVGAPHLRDRVWIAANREGERWPPVNNGVGAEAEQRSRSKGYKQVWGCESPVPLHMAGRTVGWLGSLPPAHHGATSTMDELRGIGNGQVPGVVATAWQLLTGAIP